MIQGCHLEMALDETIGATDAEWALIGPLLPSETGRGCRPAGDNRRFFDGMMWMARTGAQWRHLPPCYGKWNSVFRRYRRWVEQGVFDALLETLAELVGRDRSADMIDSTVVRAHHCAAGIKKYWPGRGAWPITGRVHNQTPCPLRRTRPPARLRPDARTSSRSAGLWAIVPSHRRSSRPASGGSWLRRRPDPGRHRLRGCPSGDPGQTPEAKPRQPRSSCLQAEKPYRAYVQPAQELAACRYPIRQDRLILQEFP